ncbi:hypothetical protein TNCV_131621 [Trichonephila clavipes]|nr:hypothetical protein TNCV_131621 [Trichonephila clavipes]
MSRKSPFIIHKNLIGIGGEPKSIKKLRSESPLTVSPHRTLNSCRGVISESDLLCASETEILEGLSDHGVTQRLRWLHVDDENQPLMNKYTADEEDMITYDVEEAEIKSHPDLVEKDGKQYWKGSLLLTPTRSRKVRLRESGQPIGRLRKTCKNAFPRTILVSFGRLDTPIATESSLSRKQTFEHNKESTQVHRRTSMVPKIKSRRSSQKYLNFGFTTTEVNDGKKAPARYLLKLTNL